MSAFNIAVNIAYWLLLGLGLVILVSIWTALIATVWVSTMRFLEAFRTASVELEEDPDEDDPRLHF